MFVLLLGAGVPGGAVRAQGILLFAPEYKGAAADFSDALLAVLRQQLPQAPVRQTSVLAEALTGTHRVLVAVGVPAVQAVAGKPHKMPLLLTLVPRPVVDREIPVLEAAGSVSALYLDQPEERQFALLAQLPQRPATVSMMLGTDGGRPTGSLIRLRQAAAKAKMRLREVVVDSERDLARATQEAIGGEVLLAHPDARIYSPQTIQHILLATYRARVPLVGFSPAYTRAGALMSLHASILTMAEQAAGMLRPLFHGGALPAPQHPKVFDVSINREVARSLGIDLPAESTVRERVMESER